MIKFQRPSVWVVQVEDYDDHSVVVAGVSIGAAVAALKARYGPPYVIEWGEVDASDPDWCTISAHFDHVPNYSAEHDAYWSIQRLDLAETEPEPEVEVQWRSASGGAWHDASVEPIPSREPVEVRHRMIREEWRP